MSNRKIIAYIATSADGFIARTDGSFDWLNRPRTAGDYGMSEFYKTVDTVIFGRKTWDQVMDYRSKGGSTSSKMKTYVFTHNPPAKKIKGVEFINGDVGEFASQLRATPGKDIWMMGGGGMIGSFVDAGAIDEFVIHVMPVFIGEGIPLIAPRHMELELSLVDNHAYPDGVVKMHYACNYREPRPKKRSGGPSRSKRS